jgi:CBS domain-containing protein
MKARDVMVSPVITAKVGATVGEVARLLVHHRISAVPVLDGHDRLAGIVSRADLVQAIATAGAKLEVPVSDDAIRDSLMTLLSHESWTHNSRVNVTVNNGVVNLRGKASSDTARTAIRVAAEATRGAGSQRPHCGGSNRGRA